MIILYRNTEDRNLNLISVEYEGGDNQINFSINENPEECKQNIQQNDHSQEIDNESEPYNDENELEVNESVECHKVFENWYHNFKPKYSRLFPWIKLWQRYIFALLIISLRQNEISEAAVFILVPQILFIVYIIWARPFRNILDYAIEISFEAINGIFLLLVILHQNFEIDCQWEIWFPATILFICISKWILLIKELI